MGLSGKDGHLIEASKKDGGAGIDLGYVGEINSTNPELLFVLLQEGYIPVISPIGLGKDGTTYNINADTAASHIAVSLQAMKLIFMTDVEGILKEGKTPIDKRTPLTPEQCKWLIKSYKKLINIL